MIICNGYNMKNHEKRDIERRLIIDIIKKNSPEISLEIDLKRLQKFSVEQGVSGHLFLYLKQKNLHSFEYSMVQKSYAVNVALNMKHLEKLERLEEVLEKEKFEIMTLKGASLLDRVYVNIGLRPMADIDIMVHSSDRDKFKKILGLLEYTMDERRPHIFSNEQTTIDLHIHALNTDRIRSRNRLFPAGMAPVWQNSRPLKNGFRWIRRPDDRDNVLLLFMHMMKHSFDRLSWWVDIVMLLEGYDEESWLRLRERARYLKVERAMKYMTYMLEMIFGAAQLSEAGFEGMKESLNPLEKRLLRETAEGNSGHEMGVLLGLLCINGLFEKIMFARESLFPGREIIEEEFGKSCGERRVLFYGHRLLQALFLLSKKFLQSSGPGKHDQL